MLGLWRVTGRPLAPIRLVMEATALAGGWLLGGSVGIGAVIKRLAHRSRNAVLLIIIGDPATAPALERGDRAASTLGSNSKGTVLFDERRGAATFHGLALTGIQQTVD